MKKHICMKKYLLAYFQQLANASGEKKSLKLAKLLSFKNSKKFKWQPIILGILSLALLILIWQGLGGRRTSTIDQIPPVVIEGGNPYIRALMRTISASEAQDSNPYTLLYGGKHFSDLSRHPNQCVTIVSGPHIGECSTAAGRYQILAATWQEKVKKYHHKFSNSLSVTPDSFKPQIQDEVVYAWLNDHDAWRTDIVILLEQGKLNQVLQLLSGTWTSLGYGTENNQITPLLSQVYQKVLAEELAAANSLN
jgi:muramidase (phage lysozyme)